MTSTTTTWAQWNLPILWNRRVQVDSMLGMLSGAAYVLVVVWLIALVDPQVSDHEAMLTLFRVLGYTGVAGVHVACGWLLGRRRRPPVSG